MTKTSNMRGWGRATLCAALAGTGGLALHGCGAAPADPTQDATETTVPALPDSILGSKLASVQIDPDHTVEFYELDGGGIAIGERITPGALATPLDWTRLSSLGLRGAYRELVRDDAADLPDALRDAEARYAELRQRAADAPAAPLRALSERLEGRAEQASTAGRAGELSSRGGDVARTRQALTADERWFLDTYCKGGDVDGTWCPTNVSAAHSGWRETMFYDIHGLNAASSGNAVLTTDRFNHSTQTWDRVLYQNLAARSGYRWMFFDVAVYKSDISGSLVHMAQRVRLSMPELTQISIYPNNAGEDFFNDIQGFKHDANNWYVTRAEYSGGNAIYSQIAKVPIARSLHLQPATYVTEPQAWQGSYPHFGDPAFVNGLIFIPTEARGGNGPCAVSVYDTNLNALAIKRLRDRGCAWMAYNPRTNLFYLSGAGATLEAYRITWNGTTLSTALDRTITLSANVGAITGGDFTPKGNLWVYTQFNDSWGVIYGIDGFSGIVQKQINVQRSGSDESEGLTYWDLDADTRAPGMRGQLHVMDLSNDVLSNDDLFVRNYRASDVSRL